MGRPKQAVKDPSVLSAVLLHKTQRGEKTLLLVKCVGDSEELTSRLSFPRTALSRTFQKAACLGTFCKPLWSRPRSTRSRSGHSSSLETTPSTGGSHQNGLILPHGPRMKVLSPQNPICLDLVDDDKHDFFFLIYCVFLGTTSVLYSVLCSPGSHLVAQQLNLLRHQHVCGHGLLHHLLRRHDVSEVRPLRFSHMEISGVGQ